MVFKVTIQDHSGVIGTGFREVKAEQEQKGKASVKEPINIAHEPLNKAT